MRRRDDGCASCDGLNGDSGKSLPVDRNGDVVANDYTGEWAGKPACKLCFDVHAKAGPVGLEAYLDATKELRADLSTARAALVKIRGAAEDTLAALGEP